ncbi:MAG: hypothetical protein QOD40_255 [Alphaproteobacteria bacterium]|jgi:hypothetical protein|nr:hypothetical protein [Alphaproteobacteria bacterium]
MLDNDAYSDMFPDDTPKSEPELRMRQRRLFAVQHRRGRHLPDILIFGRLSAVFVSAEQVHISYEDDMDVRREEVKARPEQPSLSKERARQGSTGHNVRYVLGFGLAGVIILFAVVYLFYFGH